MSEPKPGEIRDTGALRYRWTICKKCGEGFWQLTTRKHRTCLDCREVETAKGGKR